MSIVKRMSVSIGGTFLRSGLNFFTTLILARGLGADSYGELAFLMGSFVALIGLIEMGSSTAFYTFISKHYRSKLFFAYYFLWLALQFIGGITFIWLLAPDSLSNTIWQGIERDKVAFAFLAIFFQTHLWKAIVQIAESQRYTSRIQLLNVAVAVAHFILVYIAFSLEQLSLQVVFTLITLEVIIAMFVAYFYIPICFDSRNETFSGILREYIVYCSPLLIFNCLGMFVAFADTWLLKHFAGNVEQAYFAIGLQFAGVSMLVTRSVLNVFWKEVAEAKANRDDNKVRLLYSKSVKGLYLIGGSISGILVHWSPELLEITLGGEFTKGYMVLALMLIYPVHQTIGQMNGAMFHALELTKPYVITGIAMSGIALLILYVVLAPGDKYIFGLGLGAMGLAIKMLITQLIHTNVLGIVLFKHVRWRLSIAFQFISLVAFITLGGIISLVVKLLVSDYVSSAVSIVTAAAVYFATLAFLLVKTPKIYGAVGLDLQVHILSLLQKIRRV